jgi:CubicO group peptidase (beta-lactamase class C family)
MSDFLGSWTGKLMSFRRMRIDIISAQVASIWDPAMSKDHFLATVVSGGAEQVEIEVPSLQARFIGRLYPPDRIEGTWREGEEIPGDEIPVTLLRGEAGLVTETAIPLTQEILSAFRGEAGSPALAAALDRTGGERHLWVDGERRIGSGVAATKNDRWHLGSITKSITATLVARLVEAGLLQWDETAGEILGETIPSIRPEYRPVTFRHLLSHRSGLPRCIPDEELEVFLNGDGNPREKREAYARIALAMLPLAPPEVRYEYSNAGYLVLGAMLERKLGQDWETLVQTHVFTPLALRSAGFGEPDKKANLDQPVGHQPGPDGKVEPHAALADYPPLPPLFGPAGLVHMSLDDLLTYLAAHHDKTGFLQPAAWEILHTPPFGGDYAMGWVVQPNGILWHNGSNGAWYAEAQIDAANGFVAASVTNEGRRLRTICAVGRTLVAASA